MNGPGTAARSATGTGVTTTLDAMPLLGTWKLKSYVVMSAGKRSTPYGEHPLGYIHYSGDGHMHVIGCANGRNAPLDGAAPDAVRLALFDTMFAYAGTYSVHDGKVTHHVGVSWNEAWTGTEQIRLCEIDGDTLSLTAFFRDDASGSEARYTAIWERISSQN
jgi:hypothetical protein